MRPLSVLFLLLMLTGCGDDTLKDARTEAPARVAKIQTATIPRSLTAVGNAKASASVSVTPRVAGEILAINFIEGQDVAEGQPLAQIDPRPYEAVLREKRAALARSEARLRKALEDRKRFAKLAENGYVSKEAFEQTATDAAALRAETLADRAAADQAELDLAYCTVKAPISGRVGALNIDKGNMIKSGDSSPIAQIDAIAPIYVNFSVPEANLPAILEKLRAGETPVTVTPTGGKPETGVLTLVDNAVDTKTGTIRLRGVFANGERRLWPGQFVQVSLPLGVIENALLAPRRAVMTGREGAYVYAVDDENRARVAMVKPLFESGDNVVVEGDLKAGERVVVEGQVRLAPGMPIKIVN